jgi:hypothetical protein
MCEIIQLNGISPTHAALTCKSKVERMKQENEDI